MVSCKYVLFVNVLVMLTGFAQASRIPEWSDLPVARRFIDIPEDGGLNSLIKADYEADVEVQSTRPMENLFLTLPLDLLRMIAGYLPKQLAFLSTCRMLRYRVEPTKELIMTLPHDFTRSKFWQKVQAGEKVLRWMDKVTVICLYQLIDRHVMIDHEGFVRQDSDDLHHLRVRREICSKFPNLQIVIDTKPMPELEISFEDNAGDSMKAKLEIFNPDIEFTSTFYTRVFLNHRRLQLCLKLYDKSRDNQYHAGLNRNRHIAHGIQAFGFNLPCPTLNEILDLFEEFHDKIKSKTHCYDNCFQTFLTCLSCRPEFWPLARLIHETLYPIDHIISSHIYWKESVLTSSYTIMGFCEELQRSNPHKFLETIASYLNDIESLFKLPQLNRRANLYSIAKAISKLGKQKGFQGNIERLFHRFTVVFKAKTLMMKRIGRYLYAHDEPDSNPLMSEEIQHALQRVHEHLSDFNDEQLAAIGRIALERYYIRRYDILEDIHWAKIKMAIQYYRDQSK